jgi:hypothetical protein
MEPLGNGHRVSATFTVGASILAVALALPASSAWAQQSLSFSRAEYAFAGNNHVVADVNGDGRQDIVGAGAAVARVMLGNGDGTFQPRAEYPIAAGGGMDVTTGDFTGDGRLDLAVTINSPEIGLSILLNNGDGTFGARLDVPNAAGFDSPAIVTTDLDNDARLDLVVGHQIACYTAPCRTATVISVLRGNGDGTFQPARVIDVGSSTAKMAVGDFDRDGLKDLVIASHGSRVLVLLGVGDGTFDQLPTMVLIPENNLGMDGTDADVADLNRDGIDDAVIAVALNGSRTAILLGNGDGTFRATLLTEPNILIPQHQAIADYDGDGILDLALSLGWGTNGLFEYRRGNGDGTFGPVEYYEVPPDRSSISGGIIQAGDFNGDRKPDLALGVTGASPAFRALTNTTGAPAPSAPGKPLLVSPATNATVTQQPVTFDWADVPGATSYQVQVDSSSTPSSPYVLDRTVSVSQLTSTGVTFSAGRVHSWRVRARNATGTGPWSDVFRFTPQSTSTTTPAALSALTVTPTSVTGGTASQGRVTLTAAAPAGGLAVSLSSSSAAATVPASVTVPQGSTSVTFQVSTAAVAATTSVTLGATAAGVTRTATLTVTPPGQQATLAVTASGRSGERITSTPAGINVPVGSTGSAAFTTGTAITLAVSNGRDAIWSGACSSNGSKQRSCTFTLSGNASVSANVQ